MKIESIEAFKNLELLRSSEQAPPKHKPTQDATASLLLSF